MIELKHFESTDFQQLINWINTEEFLYQWGGANQFEFPLSEDQLSNYIQHANSEDSDTFAYKVVYKESGNTIGHISLGRIDKVNNKGRIGRVLIGDKSVRGLGIGQKMIREVLRIAFEKHKLHRVSLGVYDFNTSAIACYEKSGFTKEGLHREAAKVGNEYWNVWEMSILKNEWFKK
ncbi:GNAT family N-acetyltransferase [Virgibacillus sp. JSM 102003]|uniref:GNAT family N-acetyltransferase n=1 Tax=Virgibacillus sp. JSM 102003 TaxID=1562108 RepID=UPI0035C2519B